MLWKEAGLFVVRYEVLFVVYHFSVRYVLIIRLTLIS